MASAREPEGDTAGASARREAERRRANREQRVRERHPRLGGVLLALQVAPQHETSWRRGAEAEASVQASFAKRCRPGVVILHDRRIPRSRANIDHLAIAPTGVWVIDTKRYQGKARVQRPLLGRARLTIAGRDRSSLMEGLEGQVALVRSALEPTTPGVPVHGALCMVDTDLPVLGTLTFRGYPLLYRKALAKRLNADGPLGPDQVRAVAERLAARFPPA